VFEAERDPSAFQEEKRMPLDFDKPKIIQGKCDQCGVFSVDLYSLKDKTKRLCLSCFRLEQLRQLKTAGVLENANTQEPPSDKGKE
jgi:uncharacterized OB-fold protein